MIKDKLTIYKIIELIDSGDLAIPDFQRQYSWSESQVLDLLDSIKRKFPIGAITIWNSKHSYKYKKLDFLQIKNKEFIKINEKSSLFIVDGQQRLISLYLVIKGIKYEKIQKKFYINSKGNFESLKYSSKKIPLSELRKTKNEFKNIFNFKIPIISIETDNLYDTLEAFSRIHITSTPFDSFSYLLAYFASNQSQSRILLIKNKFEKLSETYGIDVYILIKLFDRLFSKLNIVDFVKKNNREKIIKKVEQFSNEMIKFIESFASLSVLIRNDYNEIAYLFNKSEARKIFLRSELENILKKHIKKSDIDNDRFNLNTLSASDQRKILELLLLDNEASDFLNSEKISKVFYKLEVHHLFPHSKYKDNCIFLLTLITQDSNRKLKDLSFNEQVKKINNKKGKILEKHLIPVDEYDRKSFIEKRAKLFSDAIKKYY